MIIEIPQAETCCKFLSLRVGVAIVIGLRLFLLLLLIIFGRKVIPLRHDPDPEYKACYKLLSLDTTEIVLVTVTITLVVLWLFIMIPAVIWEILTVLLIGCILEILIFFWIFFVMSYQISLSIVGEYVSFMLIYSIIWMIAECYILWLMWSYYVDVKAALMRRTSTSSDSGDSPPTTLTSTDSQ